jgi:two-component system response regulator FixJ
MTIARIVHIVDDDSEFRHSLVQLLESAGYATIAYGSGEAFLTVTTDLSGCVLLDVHMPGVGGLEVQARLTRLGVHLPVIVMTVQADVVTAVRAIKAGAANFIEKPFDDTPLMAMIEEAFSYPATMRGRTDVAYSMERVASLSPRERDVLDRLMEGKSNKMIAYDLNISVRTLEVHRGRMMERLGASNLADAIRVAVLASLQ